MISINKKDEATQSITVREALHGKYDAGSVFLYQNDDGYMLKLEHGAAILVTDEGFDVVIDFGFDVVIDFQNETDVELFENDRVTLIPSGNFNITVNV